MKKNEIIFGDCLPVLRGMADKSVDLVLTDPPYYRIVSEGWDRQWPTLGAFSAWVEEVGRELARVLKPNGALYWFCDDKVGAYCQVELDKHFRLLNNIVWKKPATLCAMSINKGLRSFAINTERCLFYEQKSAGGDSAAVGGGNPIKDYLRAERRKMMQARGWTRLKDFEKWVCEVTGTRSKVAHHCWADSQWEMPTAKQYAEIQSGGFFRREYEVLRREYEALRRPWVNHPDAYEVLEFPLAAQPLIHPTQKPVELLSYLLERSAAPGALVLDPFSGSGTTAVACHNLGLDFLCIEKDPDYHAASVARLEKHRAQGLLPLAAAPVAQQAELCLGE